MEAGASKLQEALACRQAAEADRLAQEALDLTPNLSGAFVLRGKLAADRGDALTAVLAYYWAYNSGDHSQSIRNLLAVAFQVLGFKELSARLADTSQLQQSEYQAFASMVYAQREALWPALKQKQKPPRPASATPAAAAILPNRSTVSPKSLQPQEPRSNTAPLSAPTKLAKLNLVRNAVTQIPAAAEVVHFEAMPTEPDLQSKEVKSQEKQQTEAPSQERIRHIQSELPDWLDAPACAERLSLQVAPCDWLEANSGGSGLPRMEIEQSPFLAVDPGELNVEARSPVTGRLMCKEEIELQRIGASLPQFELEFQPLEALSCFDEKYRKGLLFAVKIPGPVLSVGGQNPYQLCAQIALGVGDQLLLQDLSKANAAPIALPFANFKRIDLFEDGGQLTCCLLDGRKLHFDLRGLRARSRQGTQALIDAVVQQMERLGPVA